MTRKIVHKAKKSVKTVIFKSDFDPDIHHEPRLFTDTERELIMADIAYLKQKEIESGDWDKWKASQEHLKVFDRRDALINAFRSPVEIPSLGKDEYGAVIGCNCHRCRTKRRGREATNR